MAVIEDLPLVERLAEPRPVVAELADAQVEGRPVGVLFVLVLSEIGKLRDVAHPGERVGLKVAGRQRPVAEGRVGRVYQWCHLVQIEVDGLPNGGEGVAERTQGVRALEAELFEPREPIGISKAVLGDVPVDEVRAVGDDLDVPAIVGVTDEVPRRTGVGVREVHRDAGEETVHQYVRGRVVVGPFDRSTERLGEIRVLLGCVPLLADLHLRTAAHRVMVGDAGDPVVAQIGQFLDTPPLTRPEGEDRRRVMGKRNRPPLERVRVFLDQFAVGGGEFPVLLGPRSPVLEDHPWPVLGTGYLLGDFVHFGEIRVVVVLLFGFGVPVGEVLCTVDADTVGPPVHLSPLEFEQDGPDGGLAVVQFLPVHSRPLEKVVVE